MNSILTNNGAMVALQTLKGINSELGTVQEQISTGKKVGAASDNAAVWAISKTMEADVTGFKKISEGLALGKSTVAVARDASETVTDLLTQVKDKIVQSQGDGIDASSKEKIQADITALKEQIGSVVKSAQFNGRNLVDGSTDSPMNVLSSLDRDIDGNVTAANIGVKTVDLTTTQQVVDTTAGVYAAGTAATLNATQSQTITVAAPTAGVAYSIGMTGTDADASKFTPADYTTAGTATGAANIAYVAAEGDTAEDVANGLAAAYAAYAADNGLDTNVLNVSASGGVLTFTSGVTDATDTIAVRLDTVTSADNVAGGALAALENIDVTSDAEGAMTAIEGLIQKSVDAASAFGTAQNQIETQSKFVSKLTDTLKAGIGSMVDADMEEASARLKALQTQQQLGIQSLSIANQAPSSVMALFR